MCGGFATRYPMSSILIGVLSSLKSIRSFKSLSCVSLTNECGSDYTPTSDLSIAILYAIAGGCSKPKEVYQYLLGILNVPKDYAVRNRLYNTVRKYISRLCNGGYVKRVGYGRYAITKTGLNYIVKISVTHGVGNELLRRGGGFVGEGEDNFVGGVESYSISSIVSCVSQVVGEVVRGGRVHFVCVKGWGVRRRGKWYFFGSKYSVRSKQSIVEVATRFGCAKIIHSNTTGNFLVYFTAYNPVPVGFALKVIDGILRKMYRQYTLLECVRCEYSEFNGQKELWKYMQDNKIVMVKIYRSRKTKTVHIEIDFESFVLQPVIDGPLQPVAA